jgi:alpha-L-fucosidase
MLEWPVDGKVTLKSLATGSALFPETPTAVTLLGRAQPLQWSRTDAGLLVELPIEQPGESAYVLKITTQSAR